MHAIPLTEHASEVTFTQPCGGLQVMTIKWQKNFKQQVMFYRLSMSIQKGHPPVLTGLVHGWRLSQA